MAVCTPSIHVFLGRPLFLFRLVFQFDKFLINKSKKLNIFFRHISHIHFLIVTTVKTQLIKGLHPLSL